MMKRLSVTITIVTIFIVCTSWGFFAHKKINEYAIYTLPPALASFYKKNIYLISEKAVDPDKRCYIDSLESPRHYIDIDDYEEPSIDSIPIHWTKAKQKYQEKQLLLNGIVPWQISFTYNKLVKAFKNKDLRQIIRYSADLGHYIGDAHVPLHTTKNYNGQLTNQIGIHAFWESRLPEMFANHYKFIKGRSHFITDPLREAWAIVKQSNSLVDSVLMMEKELSASFSKHEKYAFIERNNVLIRTYSDDYAKAYHLALNGMVEKRMANAIQQVGSFWYSAWVEAGQPELKNLSTNKLEETTINTDNKKNMGREEW
ncbi:zinc dependent phospholipase C family protein [Sphingobacterium sp. SRCM116780]|uniref:zinc dependent phospholipase C family protein n=1 Tax=Sphingobacterium sp. SRCM116780 TaxID=2907623 RepID=UPI001F26AE17|nr:zinc dependent phospholipase C family protein [Sphingobacterium sp. SRCM116780]UIR57735.1 zinc dependent phospholipase C family protein [Sphingobacterium sp. SRCM116780]